MSATFTQCRLAAQDAERHARSAKAGDGFTLARLPVYLAEALRAYRSPQCGARETERLDAAIKAMRECAA